MEHFLGPQPLNPSTNGTRISLLNIETFCDKCRRRKAFSAFTASSREWGDSSEQWDSAITSQSFHLSFKCQGCQLATVDFLVTRRVMKLTISGRWPIEKIKFPNHIPKWVRKYYSVSAALHAVNADAELFNKSMEKLNEHYDVRRLLKLHKSSNTASENL